MTFVRQWYAWRELFRISMARLRAHRARLEGAHVSPKCLFGRGVRIERPWNVSIGTRCMFQPNVWLNVGGESGQLQIGDYTFLGRGVEIEISTNVTIGKNCLIAPGVFITDHNHGIRKYQTIYKQKSEHGSVKIGNDVWIGANAVVLMGVSIGDGAVIGAGAVVTRDIDTNAIAVGLPATILRYRD